MLFRSCERLNELLLILENKYDIVQKQILELTKQNGELEQVINYKNIEYERLNLEIEELKMEYNDLKDNLEKKLCKLRNLEDDNDKKLSKYKKLDMQFSELEDKYNESQRLLKESHQESVVILKQIEVKEKECNKLRIEIDKLNEELNKQLKIHHDENMQFASKGEQEAEIAHLRIEQTNALRSLNDIEIDFARKEEEYEDQLKKLNDKWNKYNAGVE